MIIITPDKIIIKEYDAGWIETPFKNGKKEGEQVWKWVNGKIWRKIPFKNGKQEGLEKRFDEDEKLRTTVPWENNKKEGMEVWRHKNGNLWKTIPFKNDKKEGEEIHLSENSKIEVRKIWKDGNLCHEILYENEEGGKKYLLKW